MKKNPGNNTLEKTREALVFSEKRYRRLFESAKDGILILDTESGQIVDVNPFLVKLLGYSRDQLIRKRIWDIGFFKDIITNKENFSQLKEKKYIRYEDLPLKTADGRKIDVEFVSNVYLEDHHDVIQCNIRDITDRKRYESHRQLSINILNRLNRTETTTDAIRDILHLMKMVTGLEAIGIRLKNGNDYPYYATSGFPDSFIEKERNLCISDNTGNTICYKSGNPLLECLCGNIIHGRTDATNPFYTEYGSFWTNSTTKLLATTTEKDRQTCTCNRCNSEGYESVALIPLCADSNVIGLLQLNDHRPDIFTIDLIKFFEGHSAAIGIALFRKKAEEEHKKYEQQLQLSQKRESLGVLAGGIAHDFNNLMSGIFGFIDIASATSKDESVKQYLAQAMNTIGSARGLTQQLLTFAKGGTPIRKIDHLFPFLQETAQFALSGSIVSSHFKVPKDLWPCNYDRNQIGQVISNIVINAQQAMPDGGTIEVSAANIFFSEKQHAVLSSGNYVKMSINDCGIGIPKEILHRIFDPFYSKKATGHGLGLATCYSIITRHGGCIDVESEPGKGSTFHVYLPASSVAVLSTKEVPITKHKGSGTFIVMDDQEMVRNVTGTMLGSFGYTVVCKENGIEVINFFSAEIKAGRKIAGMIFDLTVPGAMGGKQTIEEIRKMSPKTPVFVASGYAQDPVMSNPNKYGFNASISKPFRITELSEMLSTHLKKSK